MMEKPKDDTERDDHSAEGADRSDQGPGDPPAPPPSEKAKVKAKDADPGDSYEDAWYQVLKRRAGEAGDQEG